MNTKTEIKKGHQFTATDGSTWTVVSRNFSDCDGVPLGYIEIVFTNGKETRSADLSDFFYPEEVNA